MKKAVLSKDVTNQKVLTHRGTYITKCVEPSKPETAEIQPDCCLGDLVFVDKANSGFIQIPRP